MLSSFTKLSLLITALSNELLQREIWFPEASPASKRCQKQIQHDLCKVNNYLKSSSKPDLENQGLCKNNNLLEKLLHCKAQCKLVCFGQLEQ